MPRVSPSADAAKERERAERDDERREAEPRDHHRVERAAEQRLQQRERDGRPAAAPPPSRHSAPSTTRREPHHRADREVDAAGDDDRRERQREQPDLHAEPHDLERVARAEEVAPREAEDQALDDEHDEQHPLAVREEPLAQRRLSVSTAGAGAAREATADRR